MIATEQLIIIDNVLENPEQYRANALAQEFKTYDFGHCVFHGIAISVPSAEVPKAIIDQNPQLTPVLTFLRKSPQDQVEPHYIHTDIDMGEWSAVLYLNPNPPAGDGTNFWTHKETGAIESVIPHERSVEGRNQDNWTLREHVNAKFNRMVMFPSSYFHSRAIFDNWGHLDDARLIQVTFGTGAL